MDSNKSRSPALEDGRSPADLTKKELVAHLTAVLNTPAQKLNAMTREALVALFDLPYDEAIAAIQTKPRSHRKRRPPAPKSSEKAPVYEHFLTGRVRRE